jgi:hypothetical protein
MSRGWHLESGRHALAARGVRTRTPPTPGRAMSDWRDYLRRMDDAWQINGYNLSSIYLDDEYGQRKLCREMGNAINDFDEYEVMDIWNFLVKQCLLWRKKVLINAKQCYKEATSRVR